jgi:tRNA 2-thiouridine synthesizing protein A
MLYQLSYSGVSWPVRAATDGLIRRGSGLVQGLFGPPRTGLRGWTAAPATLDLRGLKCPLPVLRTRGALRRLASGRVLVVRCTDPLASIDIPNLLRETGDALLAATRDGRDTSFTIRRG